MERLTVHDTQLVRFPVSVAGTRLSVDTTIRDLGGDPVVFLHGLGCDRTSFDTALTSPALASRSLCTIDLPGHGASSTLGSESTMEHYAEVARSVIDSVAPGRVDLVCHSMGGTVGLLVADGLGRDRVASFIDIEGNLVSADCVSISRKIADQSPTDFVTTGFADLLHSVRDSPRAALRAWAGWCAGCDPAAIHTAARSLVHWTNGEKLMNIFQALPTSWYVYGEHSDVSHLLPRLDSSRTRAIPDSAHFPMVDNPSALWSQVGDILVGHDHSPA